ncbi:MAG TPA: TIGR04283 family arsenosugar biosynthesis glycosyltransferase [Opitutaceae bacterium]
MQQTRKDSEFTPVHVSVIIPTLDEAENLPACIRSVGAGLPGVEIIVSDGGSTDGTTAVAANLGARVVAAPVRHRASQLNLAAQYANGGVLLFLHADTLLPAGWLESLQSAFRSEPELAGGAFRRRFDSDSLILRATCALGSMRSRILGWFLGDQAMFVLTAEFWRLGGFRPLDTCEDLDFSVRLSGSSKTRLLGPPVLSSARRFRNRGPFVQSMLDIRHAVRFLVSRTTSQTAATPLDSREAAARSPRAGHRLAFPPSAEPRGSRRIHPHHPPFPS